MIPNISINLSYLTEGSLINRAVPQCLEGNTYSIECLYNQICPQLNNYFVKIGLIILIAVAVFSWGTWYLFNHGYKKMNFIKVIGTRYDLNEIDNRIYWDMWIRARLYKVMTIFIAIVVYLNWGK